MSVERGIASDIHSLVAWPRRAAGHRSDITENLIREQALPLGVVDVKVAAIDPDWSGLRLVWRVSNRGRPGKRSCGDGSPTTVPATSTIVGAVTAMQSQWSAC
jgi:hypothetical protein